MRNAIALRPPRRRRKRRKQPPPSRFLPPVTILGVTYRPRRPQLPLTPPHRWVYIHRLAEVAAIVCHCHPL
jgi:hypothetical protein